MTALPRILVVEDDDMVGEILKVMLDECYDVASVAEVRRALAEIAAQPINVVLLDYNLPDACGEDVAECAGRAGVPVVWMTGDLAAADALTAQHHAVLTKPF